MKWSLLLLFIITLAIAASDPDEFQIEPNEALQFLIRDRRSFLHPGKTKCEEQKREARKAYEEKCTFLGKRYCPKLSTWKAFQQWEIGGGYDRKRTPLPTKPTTSEMHTMRTHRTRLYTPPPFRTRKTSMYESVTKRSTTRSPIYSDETTTPDPFD